MRNRKLNRALVPIVILVWSLIAYRFWYEETAHEPKTLISKSQNLASDFAKIEVDSFSLYLPYRDPFLGELSTMQKRSPQEQRSRDSKIEKESKALPHILYQGSIKAKERLGLVRWDGINHRVHENEHLHQAKIKQITPQYIELLIGGNTYRIERGKSIGEG